MKLLVVTSLILVTSACRPLQVGSTFADDGAELGSPPDCSDGSCSAHPIPQFKSIYNKNQFGDLGSFSGAQQQTTKPQAQQQQPQQQQPVDQSNQSFTPIYSDWNIADIPLSAKNTDKIYPDEIKKTDYFMNAEGYDGMKVHFNKDGSRSGWVVTKNGTLVNLQQGGSINPDGSIKYGSEYTAFEGGSDPNHIGWVGKEVKYSADGKATPTGINWVWGMLGESADKATWQGSYQVDPAVYAQNPNANQAFLASAKQQGQSGIFFTNTSPYTYQQGGNMTFMNQQTFNQQWVARPTQSVSNPQQSQPGNNIQSGTISFMGKPGGCTNCNLAAKNNPGMEHFEGTNAYGYTPTTQYPVWIKDVGGKKFVIEGGPNPPSQSDSRWKAIN